MKLFKTILVSYSQEMVSDVITSADLNKDQTGSEDEMIPLAPVGHKMFKDVEHSAMVIIIFLLHFQLNCFVIQNSGCFKSYLESLYIHPLPFGCGTV